MATIQSMITLKDGMSPVLRSIEKSLTTVVTRLDRVSTVLDTAFNPTQVAATSQKFAQTATQVNRIEQELNQAGTAERRFHQDVLKALNAIHRQTTNQIRLTASMKKTPPVIAQAAAQQDRLNNKIATGAGHASQLWGKVKGLVGAYMGMQAGGGIVKTADALTQTTARLNLMNDGLQTTAQLEDKIYQAAMRSNGGFLQTADAVAKLGLRAGQVFKNNDETIAFTETLNKMFQIAGASQEEMSSATLQLTQALGSGVLRGEEFNAVFEAAPNVMQAVADYIKKPIGELKELASKGKISASVVKNALFAATDQVNEQFKSIPITWGNVWQLVKNYTIKATRPILQAISNITRNKRFIAFANEMGNIISRVAGFIKNLYTVLAPVFAFIYDAVAKIYNFINDNWSLLAPIIAGIAAAFVAIKAPLIAVWVWTQLCTIATKAWAAAQAVFNAVMAANPVVWVVLAVIALVAAIYFVIAAINMAKDTTISATGVIAGSVMWVGALIWNVIKHVINIFIGLGITVWNVLKAIWNGILVVANVGVGAAQWVAAAWNWCGENMGAIFDNIGIWWDNLWIDAQVGFNNFIADVLSKLASLAAKIQPLAELLDIDLSGLAGAAGKYSAKSASLSASKREYKKLTSFNPNVNWKTFDYAGMTTYSDKMLKWTDMGAAYDKGYDWGSNLGDKVGAFFSGKDYKNLTGGLDLNGGTSGNGLNDLGKALSGGLGKNPALDDIAKGIDGIGGDTSSINDKLNASTDDLSFMRDLAEQRAINRYYYTDTHVTQNNNNTISNGLDLNTVAEGLRRKLVQTLSAGAEGVHY